MKLPLQLDGHTVRDATGRVVISALNPCTDAERRQIVEAVNSHLQQPRAGRAGSAETAKPKSPTPDAYEATVRTMGE